MHKNGNIDNIMLIYTFLDFMEHYVAGHNLVCPNEILPN